MDSTEVSYVIVNAFRQYSVPMANSTDVAAAAGTSQSTVSRVFRGETSVAPKIAERVREAAKALNYVPNDAARSLLQGRTRRIALVVEKLTQPAFALMADMTHDELLKRNYRVVVLESDSPGGGVRDGSREIFSAVDGVLYCSADRTTDLTGFMEEVRKPVVLALRASYPERPSLVVHGVYPDHRQGTRLAIDHLRGHGHTDIAMIGATPRVTGGYATELAFVELMTEYGFDADSLRIGRNEMTYAGGWESVHAFLSDANPPTAFFATDDRSAYGAIDAARELGLRAPGDIAVIGFDDFDSSGWKAYDLTTVRIPYDRIMQRSVDILIALINGDQPPPGHEFVPVELIERSSVHTVSA